MSIPVNSVRSSVRAKTLTTTSNFHKVHRLSTSPKRPKKDESRMTADQLDRLQKQSRDRYRELKYPEQKDFLEETHSKFDDRQQEINKWKTIQVQVKRPFVPHPPTQTRPADRLKAPAPVSGSHSLTLNRQAKRGETPHLLTTPSACKKTAEALPRQYPSTNLTLERQLNLQEKALWNWSKHRNVIRKQELNLCKNLLRSPRNLLLNKSFILPPIQSGRPKPDECSDLSQLTKPECNSREDGFVRQSSEGKERTTTLVRARTKLHDHNTSVATTGNVEDTQILLNKQMNKDDLPLRRLHVKGSTVASKPRCAITGDAGDACQARGVEDEDVLVETQLEQQQQQSDIPKPVEEGVAPMRYNKPCLQVADRIYQWNEPCSTDLVEIGTEAVAGIPRTAFLKLTNLGPTVIHFSWGQEPRDPGLATGRYRPSPFCFDSCDGTLLPFQSANLRLHFKASHVGVWSEYWHLFTTPKLGPGGRGDIRFSFYGIALELDLNESARISMDKELKRRIGLKIVSRLVEDLVKCLPLDKPVEVATDLDKGLETRLLPDDVQQFEERNPGLNYHSTAMFSLFHLTKEVGVYEVFNQKKKSTGKRMNWQLLPVLLKLPHLADVKREMSADSRRRYERGLEAKESRHRGPRKWTERPQLQPRKTMYMGNLQMRRGNVDVKAVHQKLSRLVPEGSREGMLVELNDAVTSMTSCTFSPVQNPAYFVYRAAVSATLDSIARAEQTLRNRIRSMDRTTWPEGTSEFMLGFSSGTSPEMSHGELESIMEISSMLSFGFVSSEAGGFLPALWPSRATFAQLGELSSSLRDQYHIKLYNIVHEHLGDLADTLGQLFEFPDETAALYAKSRASGDRPVQFAK